MRGRAWIGALVLVVFAGWLAPAADDSGNRKVADKVELSRFSSKGDGTFTSNDIIRIFLARHDPKLAAKLVTATPQDFEALGTNLIMAPRIRLAVQDYDQLMRHAKPGSIRADDFYDEELGVPKGELEIPEWLQPFRVRDSWERLTDPKDETEAAQVSFTRDFRADDTVWKFKGAAGYELEVPDIGPLSKVRFVPNVSFDRVTGGDDESDSLAFRLPLQARYEVKARPFPLTSTLFRLSPVHQTDFEFDSQQVGGEFEMEFIGRALALGQSVPIPLGNRKEGLSLIGHLFVHVEGGSVLDNGSNTNLNEGESYFRIGPVAQLKLGFGRDMPNLLQGLSFSAEWREYEALRRGTRATRLFTGGLSYAFFDNVTLEVKYRKGRIPLTEEKVESLDVGLGFKF